MSILCDTITIVITATISLPNRTFVDLLTTSKGKGIA